MSTFAFSVLRCWVHLVATLFFALYPIKSLASLEVISSEYIFPDNMFPSVHAATLVETSSGLLAAWFAGTREGANDVSIWTSRRNRTAWSHPTLVARGAAPDGTALPCWNPVLFRGTDGNILLIYRVGQNPRTWWAEYLTSRDNGFSWTGPRRLPPTFLGPIKNKPLVYPDGLQVYGSSTENNGWNVRVELLNPAHNVAKIVRLTPAREVVGLQAIQPTLIPIGQSHILLLCRTKSGFIAQARSDDRGSTWTPIFPTLLPNPNSGIDGTALSDGRLLLVYNRSRKQRTPLNIAVSRDGVSWHEITTLESGNGEFSYPAVIQTKDGLVHIAYTWNRRLTKHVVVDPYYGERSVPQSSIPPSATSYSSHRRALE